MTEKLIKVLNSKQIFIVACFNNWKKLRNDSFVFFSTAKKIKKGCMSCESDCTRLWINLVKDIPRTALALIWIYLQVLGKPGERLSNEVRMFASPGLVLGRMFGSPCSSDCWICFSKFGTSTGKISKMQSLQFCWMMMTTRTN